MILDLFRLNGKVAVVTGANTGLGQGFCVAFAEAGATVIGVARRSCAETAAKVEAVGGTFFEVLTDLSAPDASKTVANACKKLTGRVDILVNNAGITIPETGQLWWPVPILAGAGMILFVIGWILHRKWSQEHEEP